MQKEELMLFPYIKRLEKARDTNSSLSKAPFGSIANPIGMMMDEHQNEGNRFSEISRLSHNYTIPDDGCITYEVTFKLLQEFEHDLHRHIHLENNILFPKAIEFEKKFYGTTVEDNLPKLITLLSGTSLKVLEVTGREGLQMPLHYSTKEAVIMVQEGSALLNLDEQEYLLKSGDAFIIPALENHTLSIKSDFKAKVIMELDSKIEFTK
jgi:quercetin dioxygenase-like cupin family protein